MTLDTQDEVLGMYIEKSTPVDIKLDGRISITNETEPAGTDAKGPSATSAAPNNTISATSSPSPTDTGAAVMVSGEWSLIAAAVVGAVMCIL